MFREAKPGDEHAIQEVLVRSVTEICGPDYDNDEEVIASWCANKTPQNILSWIVDKDTYIIVSEDDQKKVVGVAKLRYSTRELELCYVTPEVKGTGLGKALLVGIEEEARQREILEIELTSSITAREFYLRSGYQPSGEASYWSKVLGYPMRKKL